MEKDLNKMIDLLQVTGINHGLRDAMKTWRNKVASDYLEDFKTRKDAFFKKLFLDPPLEEAPSYWFELQQYVTWKWQVTELETRMDERIADYKAGRIHRYKFLPHDIVNHLAESPVLPDKVVEENNYFSNRLGYDVDIHYVHFSDTHIFGIIKGFELKAAWWTNPLIFSIFSQHKVKYPDDTTAFVNSYFDEVVHKQKLKPPLPRSKPKFKNKKIKLKIAAAQPLVEKNEKKNVAKPTTEENSDIDINHLLHLAQTKDVSQLINYKLWQLKKGKYDREVRDFKIRKEVVKSTVQWEHYQEVGKGNPGPPPHYFVLTKFTHNEWRATEIKPKARIYESHQDIVPQSLIRQLITLPVDKTTIRRKSFNLDYPTYHTVDVLWMRYSSNCIIGGLWDNIPQWNMLMQKQADIIKGNIKAAKGEKYRLLFHHFAWNFPAMQSFAMNFTMHLIPQIDEKINNKIK